MSQDELRRDLARWVNSFQENRSQRRFKDEEDVKSAVIDELLGILGWDVKDLTQVKKEETVTSKREKHSKKADYALKIDGETKIIIEAKKLDKKFKDINSSEYGEREKQAINYAYNKGIDWALLTNGEEWRLYNAYWRKKKLAFQMKIGDFPKDNNYSKISLLSRESVKKGELDDYFEDRPQRPDVNEEVTQVLLNARASLTESILELNKEKSTEEIREGIQTTMDRLLFMKICEDRGITEHGQLRQVMQMVEGDPDEETTLSDALRSFAFKRFRKVYNGGLFDEQEADNLRIANGPLRELLDKLYEYDFSTLDVDVLGQIYEDYLENVLTKIEEGGLEWITDNSERKEHGQFYTPQYVVDYIIDNIDLETDDAVVDPSCGSGAFLIKVFDKMKDMRIKEREDTEVKVEDGNASLSNYLDTETEADINTRLLQENIHGVDLNEESVELSRINLWLRSIQKDVKLNELDKNLRCGNSLVSSNTDSFSNYYGKGEINAFNWEEEFSEVFESGGFDKLIGNPPYLKISKLDDTQEKFLKEEYNTLKSESNTFAAFIERASNLLKEGGKLGFIVHKNMLNLKTHDKLREFMMDEFKIDEIVDMEEGVFDGVTAESIILILEKNKKAKNYDIEIKKRHGGKYETINDYKSTKVNSSRIRDTPKYVISTNMDENRYKIVEKIREEGQELKNIAEASRGIETGNNSKYLFDNEKRNELKPIVRGRNVSKFKLDGNEYIDYDEENLNNPRNPQIMKSAKILVQQNSESPIAYYDDDGVFALNSCTYIESEENQSLKSITGILNSKLMEFYFKATYTNFATITINILPNNLHPLPIKVSDSISDKVEAIQNTKRELDNLELQRKNFFDKYGSGKGEKLESIVKDSEFVNKIASSRASIKEIDVTQEDEVVLIKVRKYDGWIDVLKLSLEDEIDRNYLSEYLRSLKEDEIENEKTKLTDNLLSLEIPDWKNSEVKDKIVSDIKSRKSKIKGLKDKIRRLETELEVVILKEYDLEVEEVEEILNTLNVDEHTEKAIMTEFV
jgi:type I restriction-modification system DNA methylase subunit